MDKFTIARNLQACQSRPCGHPELRPAAVLVPVFPGDPGSLRICFIRRHHAMRSHAGQIAFPGGAFDESDGELAQTALRETHEELGINSSHIEVLGSLDEGWTPSGYRLTPFVGWMDSLPELLLSADEVTEVIEADVQDLMRPDNFREEYLERHNTRFRMVSFNVPGGPIWGATARVLFRFLQLGLGWREDDCKPWDQPLS